MGRVLLSVCSLSLSGSVLILLLLALRPLLRDRIGQGWQYYLWLIPLLRLLLPFSPKISLTGTVLERLPTEAVTGELWMRAPDLRIPEDRALAVQQAAPAMGVWELLFLLWAAVAGVLLFRALWQYGRCLRTLRRESSPMDGRAEQLYRQICSELGMRRVPELRLCPALRAPMQAGCLCPMVLLSSGDMEETVLRAALLHELTHYRRGDVCYKWLVEGAVCLHWFNPLVRLLRREIERRCELSCDEGVIRRLDEKGRRAYGSALLALARPAPDRGILTLAMSGDAQILKERLEAIMNIQPRNRKAAAMAVGVTAALCLCAVLVGAYAAELPEETAEQFAVQQQAEPVTSAEQDQAEPTTADEPAAVEELLRERAAAVDWDALALGEETACYPLDTSYQDVTVPFGTRVHPITGLTTSHDGTDVAADSDAPVYAPRSGVVLLSAFSADYGNYVVIGWDDGAWALFAHLSANAVLEGDQVTRGQIVGYVGQTGKATGPHLHMEVWEDGVRIDPEEFYSM